MESIPDWSTAIPAPRNPPRITEPGVAAITVSATFHLTSLLREALAAFVANSGLVLVIAWAGFAACAVGVQGLLSLTGLTSAFSFWLLLVGAIAGVLLHALAQGALAWIGLRGDKSKRLSLAGAWHASTSTWHSVLPGTVFHAVLTFACALSLTPFLISSGLMGMNLEPIDPSLDSLPRLAATRSLDAAALGVLHPLGEWLAPSRAALRPVFLQTETPDPEAYLAYAMANHMDPTSHHEVKLYTVPMSPFNAVLIALVGLALMVAGEVLLRFYAAAAVNAQLHTVPVLRGMFGPLLESARLGSRNVRLMLSSVVLLRLLARAIQIVCLIVTVSVVESAVLPQLASSSGAQWLLPAGRLAGSVGSAAVSALLLAFCELCDARLYAGLTRTRAGNPATNVLNQRAELPVARHFIQAGSPTATRAALTDEVGARPPS